MKKLCKLCDKETDQGICDKDMDIVLKSLTKRPDINKLLFIEALIGEN